MSYEYRLPVVILLLLVGLGLFARTIYGRFLVLKAGKPETRWDLVENRVRALLEVGLGQAKMFKEPASGLLHALTFWGFVVLGARTTQLFVQGFSPDWPLPFIEPIYAPIKDFTAAIVLLSILGFFYRRLVVKPKRIAYSGEALLILGFIGGLMVSQVLTLFTTPVIYLAFDRLARRFRRPPEIAAGAKWAVEAVALAG